MLATALMVSSVQFVVHSHPDHRWILVVTVGFTHSVDMDSMDDKEIIKVSVLDEIRRFQDEINKVQAENVKFYQWKLRRSSKTPVPRPRGGATLGCAISTDSLLTTGQKKKGQKRVSYCEAVTVFGSSESLGLLLCYFLSHDSDLEISNSMILYQTNLLLHAIASLN